MTRVASDEKIETRFIGDINTVIKNQHAQRVAQLKPRDWIVPSLLNSWVNFGGGDATAGYYVTGGNIVRLKGKLKLGVIGGGMFALPAGYRPSETMLFAVPSNSAFGILQIDTSGNVTPIVGNNTYVDISGVTFRV